MLQERRTEKRKKKKSHPKPRDSKTPERNRNRDQNKTLRTAENPRTDHLAHIARQVER
jgi:hypothetical protein